MEQTATAPAFTTANGQDVAFDSGIAKFENASPRQDINPNAVSPHAVRWLWNPFAYVDVSDRPVSGYLHLKAGQFIPITTQAERIPEPGQIFGVSSPGKRFGENGEHIGTAGADPNGARYITQNRSAYKIANELADAYTDKGVQIIGSLTNVSNPQAVSQIYNELLREGLVFAQDQKHPDYPVPNLSLFDNHLRNVALPKARAMEIEGVKPADVIADVIKSVEQAIAHCRGVTDEARRAIANNLPGFSKSFDAYQKRCFLALGEPVPNDLGEMWGQQTNGTNGSAPVMGNSDELARLRAENEQLRLEKVERQEQELKDKIAALEAENERLKGGTPAPEPAVATCDFIKANGDQCKGKPSQGTTRCNFHQITADTKEETEDGNEE